MKPRLFYNTGMHIVYILKSCKDPIKCYVGIPKEFEEGKKISAGRAKTPDKVVRVKEIAK